MYRFSSELDEAFRKAPSARDAALPSGFHTARLASAQGGEMPSGQAYLQLQVMLLAEDRSGQLVGHRLWLTERALSITKRMLEVYGFPDPTPNAVVEHGDFEALPKVWIYVECSIRKGRKQPQIENVVPWQDTDTDGPSEDRL